MPEVTRVQPSWSIVNWFRGRVGFRVAVHTTEAKSVPHRGTVIKVEDDYVELTIDGVKTAITYKSMESWYQC